MEYEVKFACDAWQAHYISAQLGRLCEDDKQFETDYVNSIYFDTTDWRFAMDKASSDYNKTKVRVRWYSSANNRSQSGPRFLEIKHKIGSKRNKHRVRLPATFDQFHADNYSAEQLRLIVTRVVSLEASLANLKLVPALYVSYHRRRYTEPFSRTRIALDEHIQGRALTITSPMGRRPVELEQAVLEVKGQESALPIALRNALTSLLKKDAFSKYYKCFTKLGYYKQ